MYPILSTYRGDPQRCPEWPVVTGHWAWILPIWSSWSLQMVINDMIRYMSAYKEDYAAGLSLNQTKYSFKRALDSSMPSTIYKAIFWALLVLLILEHDKQSEYNLLRAILLATRSYPGGTLSLTASLPFPHIQSLSVRVEKELEIMWSRVVPKFLLNLTPPISCLFVIAYSSEPLGLPKGAAVFTSLIRSPYFPQMYMTNTQTGLLYT